MSRLIDIQRANAKATNVVCCWSRFAVDVQISTLEHTHMSNFNGILTTQMGANWLDTATWLRNVTFYDSQVVNDEPRLRLTVFASVPRWCYVMETQDVQTLALSRGCPCQAMICVDLSITLGLISPNFLIGYNSNLFLLGPGRNCRLKSHWSRMVTELVEGGSMRKDQSTTWTITALLKVDLLKLFGCLLDCNASGRCLLVSYPYLCWVDLGVLVFLTRTSHTWQLGIPKDFPIETFI